MGAGRFVRGGDLDQAANGAAGGDATSAATGGGATTSTNFRRNVKYAAAVCTAAWTGSRATCISVKGIFVFVDFSLWYTGSGDEKLSEFGRVK